MSNRCAIRILFIYDRFDFTLRKMASVVRNNREFSYGSRKFNSLTGIGKCAKHLDPIGIAEHFLLIPLRKIAFRYARVMHGDQGFVLRTKNRIFVIYLLFNR